MKVLFIGGTGNISTWTSQLAVERGIDLYLLNRGIRPTTIEGATTIQGDITQVEAVNEAIKDHYFDCVVNWIAFTQDHVERDIELFKGKCSQYIFISSASAYQKPLTAPFITESTPLANPYWQYSRNKIACEERLIRAYREEGFPAVIVRPSHTYGTIFPTSIGAGGSYCIPKRILEGKPVIVHGDGTTLWTLTHSEDFAKAFVPLMGHPNAIGHAFHITSDFLITWNQIYEQLGYALGVEPNIVHIPSRFIAEFDFRTGEGLLGDKMWCVMFDNSKIKSFVPEFVATIPFHIGIRYTLDWFQADAKRMEVPPEQDKFMDDLLAAYQNR
jgi:nucleoside-diphosphate-sugar epimerase